MINKLLLLVLVLFSSNLPANAEDKFVIANVNIIDVSNGAIIESQDVVIAEGRIVVIGKHKGITQSPNVVDATGKFLIPGLMDMHVHVWLEDDLILNLANGVTFVRNMWGQDDLLNIIKKLEKQEIQGSSLYTTTPIIDGDPPIWEGSVGVKNASQVPSLISEMKGKGYDSIKVYSKLPLDSFNAISKAAQKDGLTIVGHIPIPVGTLAAVEAGFNDIHHLTDALVYMQKESSPYYGISREELQKHYDANSNKTRVELSENIDWNKAADYAALLKKNDVWSTVTLLVNKRIRQPPAEKLELMKDERLKYMGDIYRSFWTPKNDFRLKNISDEEYSKINGIFPFYLRLTNVLQEKGAKILMGSDTPNPFIYPGFSVHEELELLVEAGLTPLEAIQTATLNPAAFLKRNDMGSVSTGNIADLLLLDKNPLTDIRNSQSIAGVVSRGQWFTKQQLEQMLVQVERNVVERDKAASKKSP